MDKKLVLNAKMNVAMAVCEFWIQAAKLCDKMHNFVLRKAKKALAKEYDIVREMLNEDYSESFKNELREILEMQRDPA